MANETTYVDIIKSKDNKIFKKSNSLSSKKFRDKYGQYILEGEKLVLEAMKKDLANIVVAREDKDINLFGYKRAFVFMEGKLFDRLTLTENSQGVFAIVDKREFSKEEFISLSKNKNLIIIDRLQDPGNMGTILRTAIAAGYGGAIIIKGSADVYSPKVVRSAANGLFNLPIFMANDEVEALAIAREGGRIILGTSLDGDVYDKTRLEPEDKVAIVIGNEGQGVSPKLLASTDINVKIPMSEDIESLNAAVAAGILMYNWKGI